ncbi:MAG: hypothetical protein JXB46_06270 [Candidatus Eisenbacteria bacterium]|nr:hypothetical protein [Candidatus Eisenbacteria bacterium]
MTKSRIAAAAALVAFVLAASDLSGQSLKVKNLTSYWDGNLCIAGLVENSFDYSVRFVSLGLVCRDDAGKLVHTDTTYALCSIPPGVSIPFLFLISPDDATGIKRYSVSVDDYSQGGGSNFGFEVAELAITERNDMWHKYSGIVKNRNDSAMKFVQIAFIGFDDADKMVVYETTYANRSTIPAGDESVFELLINTALSRKVKKYRCFAVSD